MERNIKTVINLKPKRMNCWMLTLLGEAALENSESHPLQSKKNKTESHWRFWPFQLRVFLTDSLLWGVKYTGYCHSLSCKQACPLSGCIKGDLSNWNICVHVNMGSDSLKMTWLSGPAAASMPSARGTSSRNTLTAGPWSGWIECDNNLILQKHWRMKCRLFCVFFW